MQQWTECVLVGCSVLAYSHSSHSLHAISTTTTLPLPLLLQAKSRLDLSTQTAKQNYQKELDARDEELDKIRSTMNKRVRSLEATLEEEHSEKQAAVKVKRLCVVCFQKFVHASMCSVQSKDVSHTHTRTHAHAHTTHTGVQEKQRLEVQLDELQTSMLNPMEEQKLRKQLKKSRVLIKDLQQELDYTRESGRNSTALRSLRHQLEEKEDIENSLNKTIKKLNAELAEVQELNEDLERKKGEVEAKVSELTREKNELELRCEEEQDEVEEMAEKQRQYAAKVSVSGAWTACGPGLTHHHQWWADDLCVPVYQLWASRTLREPLVCLICWCLICWCLICWCLICWCLICWCLYCIQFEGHGVLLLHLVSHCTHTLARIHTFGYTFMHPLLLMLQHT